MSTLAPDAYLRNAVMTAAPEQLHYLQSLQMLPPNLNFLSHLSLIIALPFHPQVVRSFCN